MVNRDPFKRARRRCAVRFPVHFPETSGKQHYFAALAGLDQFKSLGKVFEGEGVGQDGAEIEAGFEKTGQTIPGAEEAAAGNAMDTDTFKNDFIGEIAGDGAGWNTEQGDTAAVFHGAKGMVQRSRVSGHLQRSIDAFTVSDLQNRRSNGICSVGVCVQHVVDSYLLRQPKAIVTDIGGDNCRGSGRAGDGGGEEAGRAAPGDQDCVAGEILASAFVLALVPFSVSS